MKRILFTAAFLFSICTLKQANAQLNISLNVNVGSQPDWGPTGYDHVEYYYLPDIDCYYYVPGKQFVYQNGSQWVWRSSLPPQYSNYDLYNSYKVVVNKPKPYINNTDYRSRYSSYKGRHDQSLIRDSKDQKYKRSNGDNNRPQVNKPAQGRPNNNNNKPTQNRPTQNRPTQNRPTQNQPTNNQKPGRSTDDHRPATDNHSTPQKQKPTGGRGEGKKDDNGHH
jgi:hypothetical protein